MARDCPNAPAGGGGGRGPCYKVLRCVATQRALAEHQHRLRLHAAAATEWITMQHAHCA